MQKESISLHFKEGLSRHSVQKGSISAMSLIASHALEFYSIKLNNLSILFIKLKFQKSIFHEKKNANEFR